VKLTKRVVESATADSSQEAFLWDAELRGFGLRVHPSGRRSYLVQYKVSGRTRRLALGAHGVLTVDQARRLAIQALAAVRGGGDPSRDRRCESVSFADLAARYLREHAELKKRPSSIASDQSLLKRVLTPRLGTLPVSQIGREDISRLHHSLHDTPIRANRAIALLSKIMNLAERWGVRPDGSNPCRHVERYRESKRERFLSAAETARLGDALRDLEAERKISAAVAAAVRMLLFTGARRGEICGLRWEHVDFEGSRLALQESKTGAKTIPLNAPALEVLAGLPRRCGWVFPTEVGDSPLDLSRPWDRVRARAGLPDLRIHDLRHSHASVLAAAGVSLLVIGRVLGHKVPATTARYAHLSDDPVREASEIAGARLVAAMSGQPRVSVTRLSRS